MAGNIEVVRNSGYIALTLKGVLDADLGKELESEIPKIGQVGWDNLMVLCEGLIDLQQSGLRAMLLLQKQVAGAQKHFRLIGANSKIQSAIKEFGVTTTLQTSPTIRDALVSLNIIKVPVLDVNFINPFLESTLNALKVQVNVVARPGKPYKKDGTDKFGGDISGVISLVSDAFSGSVIISFPSSTFLKLMSHMLGENFTEITKEISDGAGEITNIIFGQAKVALNQKGYGIKTAIPTVVTGKDHSVQSLSKGPRLVIPFDTDFGGFVIEISLAE